MVTAILLVLLGICLSTDISMEYNEEEDSSPNNILHRIIRVFHDWIYDEESTVQK